MKVKQLEAIQAKHKSYLDRGKLPDEPKMGKRIALALINGEPVKIKSTQALVALCKGKIAECDCYRDGRSLKMEEIFESCKGFDAEQSEWKKKCSEINDAVRKYSIAADKILRDAELDDDADPKAVSDALAAAAEKHGLRF